MYIQSLFAFLDLLHFPPMNSIPFHIWIDIQSSSVLHVNTAVVSKVLL